MKINIKDDDIFKYAKEQLDAAIRSIVRSEVATLINTEMEKKLKDVTPHSLQVAISGRIEKEVTRVVNKAFEDLNIHGIDTTYKSWDEPTLFVQKVVWGIRDELRDRLWKYVSAKVGFNLDTKLKEK
jgi:hypothetical protein